MQSVNDMLRKDLDTIKTTASSTTNKAADSVALLESQLAEEARVREQVSYFPCGEQLM